MTDEQCNRICNAIRGLAFGLSLSLLSIAVILFSIGHK